MNESEAGRIVEVTRLIRASERVAFLVKHLISASEAMKDVLEVAPDDVVPEMSAASDALLALVEAGGSAYDVLATKIELNLEAMA